MAISHKDLQFREIYTKALCGKGRKFSQVTHTVTPPHDPSSILGAWIINHRYEADKSNEGVEVLGTYDINIWYSYDKNSKTDVAKETISYSELVPFSYLDPKFRASSEDVSAEATQEPNCIEAHISSSGASVIIKVEREFRVEMVAETKVCVLVSPNGSGDFEDKGFAFGGEEGDYEDLDPDFLDDEAEEFN